MGKKKARSKALESTKSKAGFQVIHYDSGDRFEGFLNDFGNRDGQGAYFWANGEYYIGQWRQGLMHGKGSIKYTTSLAHS